MHTGDGVLIINLDLMVSYGFINIDLIQEIVVKWFQGWFNGLRCPVESTTLFADY